MSISISAKGGPSEHASAGIHQAVCSGVYDMGEQDGFQGKRVRKIAIMFEIDQRYTEGEYAGKRMVVANTYSAFFSDKSNLRKLVEGWLGKKFPDDIEEYDVETLLGKQCCLNMILNEKGYANMQSIMPMMANMQPMAIETPGYIPKWITEKAPHLHSATEESPMPQSAKGTLTKDSFENVVSNIIALNTDARPKAFKLLWEAVEKRKSELTPKLYFYFVDRFKAVSGYDPIVNQQALHFDDQDIPF
jgi:hypothetical protein